MRYELLTARLQDPPARHARLRLGALSFGTVARPRRLSASLSWKLAGPRGRLRVRYFRPAPRVLIQGVLLPGRMADIHLIVSDHGHHQDTQDLSD